MAAEPLTIWCNADLDEPAMERLREAAAQHRLIVDQKRAANAWEESAPSPELLSADVAFGQPSHHLSAIESPAMVGCKLGRLYHL